MEIIWAEEAFRAWQDTIDYIVEEFGVQAAEKFYNKTEENGRKYLVHHQWLAK